MTLMAMKPKKSLLSSVRTSVERIGLRIVVYGPEGIGKTTLGANAPKPIFIAGEKGFRQLRNIAHFEEPKSWGDVLDDIQMLLNEEHEYQTLVVDTLDWIEPLVWSKVCRDAGNVRNITEVGGGYGNGFQAALSEWRSFFALLDQISERGMQVLLLAHAHVKPFKNPEGPDYDRYVMKLNDKAGSLVREWADIVLFTNFETVVELDNKKAKKGKGYGSVRMVYSERTAAYDAKNGYGLPASFPLSWSELSDGLGLESPTTEAPDKARIAALLVEIEQKLVQLGDADVTKKVNDGLPKISESIGKLVDVSNRLSVRIMEKEAGASS